MKTIASEEVYSVDGNRWAPVPNMQVPRSHHGSCTVANYIYVACGRMHNSYGPPFEYLQSIERINMNAIDDGWEELLVSSNENLSPRSQIFMAGLSCDELVIIGGTGKQGLRGDAYVLDIPKMRLKTVIRSTEKSIKFAVVDN